MNPISLCPQCGQGVSTDASAGQGIVECPACQNRFAPELETGPISGGDFQYSLPIGGGEFLYALLAVAGIVLFAVAWFGSSDWQPESLGAVRVSAALFLGIGLAGLLWLLRQDVMERGGAVLLACGLAALAAGVCLGNIFVLAGGGFVAVVGAVLTTKNRC